MQATGKAHRHRRLYRRAVGALAAVRRGSFTPRMGSLDYHRTVIAYHGCDREVLRAVLDGQPLQSSERAYDWLGRGIYFWEHGPQRALEWAQNRVQRGDGRVKNPAVIGAYIHL